MVKKTGYLSDVTDEEWAFVLRYLLLCRESSPQREYELRVVFNAVRWIAKTGSPWRSMPERSAAVARGLPADAALARCANCFETLVHNVHLLLREWAGRKGQPTAVCIDSRTLQSTPESGARAR